jgi:4-amino-4-deoxy-L-arabinose transferase-like glycosyltransferase
MTARALVLVPFVLVSSIGPGFFFLRRTRWNPLEKICGSIALSLLIVGGLSFAVYVSGLPSWGYYGITAIVAGMTLAGADAWGLTRGHYVRRTAAAFGLLVIWTLGLQALIRHYSGGDWCCDWVEHYQRSLFFLERWPRDFRFIDRYPLTTRPPLMNLVCAYFLANVGKEFALYQIAFSLVNLFVFFPCCLFARRFAPRVKQLALLVAVFLAFNPMFFMNTTFAWTKALTAFFVVLSVWLYLAGWRKNDRTRISAAFICLSAGLLVHFSALPYAVFLGLAYLTSIWRWQHHRARALAIVALPAVAIGLVWLAWSIVEYGTGTTFTANATVAGAASGDLNDNLLRIGSNTWHTFRPYIFPGQPEDSTLRRLTDRTFTFYQENFLGAIGSINAYAVVAILVATLGRARSGIPLRERRFWWAFIPFSILVGIAIDGETSPSGVANICLQPLVYLGVALVAARYILLSRGARILIWAGVLTDFILGIALEVHMESQMRMWARTPNWDWKQREHLVYLGDLLETSATTVRAVLLVAALCGLAYLGRLAFASPADGLPRRTPSRDARHSRLQG